MASTLSARAATVSKSPKVSVLVGYTAAYAIWVHENLNARHKPGKIAKFLEEPARVLDSSGELARIVLEALRKGKSMAQALILAGLRIQRESQKVVPIDTGALKGSAFTVMEQV